VPDRPRPGRVDHDGPVFEAVWLETNKRVRPGSPGSGEFTAAAMDDHEHASDATIASARRERPARTNPPVGGQVLLSSRVHVHV